MCKTNITELTADLSAVFVSNNRVGAKDLPELIASTHAALAALENSNATPEAEAEPEWTPTVSARKSLGADRRPPAALARGRAALGS